MNLLEIENHLDDQINNYYETDIENNPKEEEENEKEENYLEIIEKKEKKENEKDEEDNENYSKKMDNYVKLLQEYSDYFSRIDGGYKGKLEAYIKKRNEESNLYREVNKISDGKDCDLSNINELVADIRWRTTTKINGPAWQRYLERNPPTKIRGLTKEEEAIVRKNIKDKELWMKIMKGIENVKEEKPRPPSKKVLKETELKNFMNGNFHLIRSVPTSSERGQSLRNWQKGIFYPWELDEFDTQFPYQLGLDSNERPSASVIKVGNKYIRHIEKDHSDNRYTHQNKFTTLTDGFKDHYREERIRLADNFLEKALLEKKEKKEPYNQLKPLKLNQRVKKATSTILLPESSVGTLGLLPSVSAEIEEKNDDDSDENDEEEEEKKNEDENNNNNLNQHLNQNQNQIEEEKDDQFDSTGFQDESQSLKNLPRLTSLNKFNSSIISTIKSMSNSIMSWSKHDESDQGPVIPLVSLEPDKNTKQQNNIDFSKHHHPGEKPGEDAQKMLNGIEDDNEKPFSDSINIQRSVSKKNETRLISLTTATQTERRTGKRLNGHRPYIDSPRREKNMFFDWSCYSSSQVSIYSKSEYSLTFLQRLIDWISKRIKQEKISPEIRITPQENKVKKYEDFSVLNNEEKKGSEKELIPDSINENNYSEKKTKQKQKQKGRQKFEVLGKENENEKQNGNENGNKNTLNRQNSKPKSKSKKQTGIIRSESIYAVSSSTKETKKEKKRREKEMKKKVEEDIKKMKMSDPSQPSQVIVWKDRLKSFPSEVYKYFTANPYASRFQIRNEEQEEEINEKAFEAAEKTPSNKLFIETLIAVRRMKIEAKKKVNQAFRSVIGGLYVPFPDETVYTVQDLRREAIYGHYETVVDLLEHWSDLSPNDRCLEGDTPFYAAVMKCLEGMPEDENGYALEFGFAAVWKKFKSLFSEKTRRRGNLMIVLNILDHYGGDVNILKEDRDGGDAYGLIHQAAEKNLVQLAKWLYSRNVDVHRLTSETRRTPLMLAALAGHNEMIVRLLHMGAIDTINKLDPEGNTALHFAAAHCQPEYIQYMMICGAEKSLRNKNNRLPIEEARMRGKLENVEAIAAYKDRTKLQRPQIQYFHEEVKNGKKGV